MNYTGNIINNPLAVAALIFLGFIMLALYGSASALAGVVLIVIAAVAIIAALFIAFRPFFGAGT